MLSLTTSPEKQTATATAGPHVTIGNDALARMKQAQRLYRAGLPLPHQLTTALAADPRAGTNPAWPLAYREADNRAGS